MKKSKATKPKIEFTVRRKKWLGGGRSVSKLRNDSGSMCCLGFLGRACGIQPSELINCVTPVNTGSNDAYKFPRTILSSSGIETTLVDEIIEVNDGQMKPEEREAKLTKLFAKGGIKVNFK